MPRKKPAVITEEIQNIETRAQARKDGPKPKQSKGGASRWDGVAPADRKAQMQAVALARPKITAEDLELLAWLRAHREPLAVMVENFTAYQLEQANAPDVSHLAESSRENSAIDSATPAGSERMGTDSSRENRAVLDNCSVCLGPLYDLDSPCETCTAAGRLIQNPDELHAAQSRAANPKSTAATVYDVPRASNAIEPRAPIPPPAPPPRVYTSQETCRSCGRLPELHESFDPPGPIGHRFVEQTV